ncbi:MAG TPA: ABC transporter ATP-binding protein [Burkholderiales bacterium]|jgi:NitT/TauT family transport system ATP-binding protein|nr:ABC transporter ATP-binding protein [Burkholderiales bacterium]
MASSAIEITGVTKVYPGDNPVTALENIDLEIADGEFAALLGPSGCGKSTLLNLLAGFETVTAGNLHVYGEAVTAPGPQRAVVFQEAALFPWLNVWENVVFGPKVQGMPAQQYEQKASETLKLVGLENFAKHLPVQLSGGMRQRVGIARVLVMEPTLLLMDEPFGALDAQTRLTMQQLLLDVWEGLKKTVVFVTHDIDEAILLADVIYVMSARPGRIATRIPVEVPRPRNLDTLTDVHFNEMKKRIMHEMRVDQH